MHERNLYKTPPDFESLAHAYPPLRPQSVLPSTLRVVSYAILTVSFTRRKMGPPPSISTTRLLKGHLFLLLATKRLTCHNNQAFNSGTFVSRL